MAVGTRLALQLFLIRLYSFQLHSHKAQLQDKICCPDGHSSSDPPSASAGRVVGKNEEGTGSTTVTATTSSLQAALKTCSIHTMLSVLYKLVWSSRPLHQRGKGLVQTPYKTCAAGIQFIAYIRGCGYYAVNHDISRLKILTSLLA